MLWLCLCPSVSHVSHTTPVPPHQAGLLQQQLRPSQRECGSRCHETDSHSALSSLGVSTPGLAKPSFFSSWKMKDFSDKLYCLQECWTGIAKLCWCLLLRDFVCWAEYYRRTKAWLCLSEVNTVPPWRPSWALSSTLSSRPLKHLSWNEKRLSTFLWEAKGGMPFRTHWWFVLFQETHICLW